MADPITPNMGLTLPGINTTASPTYAQELNDNFSTTDAHDHTAGRGAPLTPASLNINTDLPFNTNNATMLRSTRYIPISLGTLTGVDIGCIVVSGVDLYYVDSLGNQIRLTASGGIAGTPGSIANLTSPASATWVSGSATFVWQANAGVAANMDAATYILRYPGSYPAPAGNYIALQAPSTLATGYALTFPGSLPVSNSFFQLNSDGSLAAGPAIAQGITKANLAAVGQQISPSSGTFNTASVTPVDVTGVSVTITTTGRPVMVFLISDASQIGSFNVQRVTAGTTFVGGVFYVDRDAGTAIIGECEVSNIGAATSNMSITSPASSLNTMDVPAAGTHTYKLKCVNIGPASSTVYVNHAKLVAYEL